MFSIPIAVGAMSTDEQVAILQKQLDALIVILNQLLGTQTGSQTGSNTVVDANWKTYSNTAYPFSFKYPPDFTFRPVTSSFVNIKSGVEADIPKGYNPDHSFQRYQKIYAGVFPDVSKSECMSSYDLLKVQNTTFSKTKIQGDCSMDGCSVGYSYKTWYNDMCYGVSVFALQSSYSKYYEIHSKDPYHDLGYIEADKQARETLQNIDEIARKIASSFVITNGVVSSIYTINLLYPIGGEQFSNNFRNSLMEINWKTSIGWNGNVSIDLVDTSSKVVRRIADNVPNNGKFSWHGDVTLPDGSYKLLISSGYGNVNISDTSSYFMITSENVSNPYINAMVKDSTFESDGSGINVAFSWNANYAPKDIVANVIDQSGKIILAKKMLNVSSAQTDVYAVQAGVSSLSKGSGDSVLYLPGSTPAGQYKVQVCDVTGGKTDGSLPCGTSGYFSITSIDSMISYVESRVGERGVAYSREKITIHGEGLKGSVKIWFVVSKNNTQSAVVSSAFNDSLTFTMPTLPKGTISVYLETATGKTNTVTVDVQ